jgi:hypothetical protein
LFKKDTSPWYVTPSMLLPESGCVLRKVESDKFFERLPDLPNFEATAQIRQNGKEESEFIIARMVVKRFGPRIERVLKQTGKIRKIQTVNEIYQALLLPDLPGADEISDEIVSFLEVNSPLQSLKNDIEEHKAKFELSLAHISERPDMKPFLADRLQDDINAYDKMIELFEVRQRMYNSNGLFFPFKQRSIHRLLQNNDGRLLETTRDLRRWSERTRAQLVLL